MSSAGYASSFVVLVLVAYDSKNGCHLPQVMLKTICAFILEIEPLALERIPAWDPILVSLHTFVMILLPFQ
ncbi:MAG: hypothetical protein COA36_00270 [Desulfotalea sp.]|nr:MAG: hypothetical protein COA36_00270 [Desulfotalea sp.]